MRRLKVRDDANENIIFEVGISSFIPHSCYLTLRLFTNDSSTIYLSLRSQQPLNESHLGDWI
jgi:hypothetical protein